MVEEVAIAPPVEPEDMDEPDDMEPPASGLVAGADIEEPELIEPAVEEVEVPLLVVAPSAVVEGGEPVLSMLEDGVVEAGGGVMGAAL